MNFVMVITKGGKTWNTSINGTKAEAEAYFVGQEINIGQGGNDEMVTVDRIIFFDENVIEAARLLGAYSGGQFDLWALAGKSKATCRQHVMTTLVKGKGAEKNLPQKDCGVNAMRDKFYEHINPPGDCIATREDYFVNWCKAFANGVAMTEELYLDYRNNFLTIAKWAEYHRLDLQRATIALEAYKAIRDHLLGV